MNYNMTINNLRLTCTGNDQINNSQRLVINHHFQSCHLCACDFLAWNSACSNRCQNLVQDLLQRQGRNQRHIFLESTYGAGFWQVCHGLKCSARLPRYGRWIYGTVMFLLQSQHYSGHWAEKWIHHQPLHQWKLTWHQLLAQRTSKSWQHSLAQVTFSIYHRIVQVS